MTNMDPDIAIQKEHRSIQRRRSINDISEPYPASNQSNANAKKTLTSHKNLWNNKHKHNEKATHDDDDGDDDTKSEISQGSEITSSSVFTTTCIKLKGYLKKSHNRKCKVKNHRQTSTNLSSAEEGHFKPKYRSKTSIGSSGSTATTVVFAANNTSPTRGGSRSSRNLDEGKSDSIKGWHIVEEEPSPNTPGALPLSACNKGKETALKGPPPPSRNSGVDRATHVFDLPWRDNASDGRLHGHYSGPVDNKLRPHGEGMLVLEGNSFLKFYGRWTKGELVSPLINEDEKRERELANTKEQKRKSSREHTRKSRNESRRKSRSCKRRISTRLDCSDHLNGDNRKPKELVSTDSSTIAACKNDTSPRRRPPQKYGLGDVARTPRHMVIQRSKDKAIHSASLLKKYDQAFIKRSNGLWTCAVLAERALQPTTASSSHWYAKHEIDSEKMDLEESMLFVTNEDGATKIVKRRHWARFIRCLRKDDDDK
mmetsp:Transcript_8968/g.19420  ORF Transcript_8968/g.19420 Transcript_8968/m.19420 type:complete len:483 (-) Transcript_8968:401-1849(-)